ncbi:MAG: hypothetical protein HY719_04180 [Planctomycetes bacterium]|nr:hypothetical protein [Planctomycetota bacterium]
MTPSDTATPAGAPAQAATPAAPPAPAPRQSNRAALGAGISIAAAAWAFWWNSLGNDFQFDDQFSTTHNSDLLGYEDSLWGVLRALIGGFYKNRPVTNLTILANYRAGSLVDQLASESPSEFHAALSANFGRLAPMGYRLVNVFIHSVNGVLVFFLVNRMLNGPRAARDPWRPARSWPVAWAAALLWTAHPIHVMAVTYVTQRATSLAATFVLLAALAFFRARESPGRVVWRRAILLAAVLLLGVEQLGCAAFLLTTWTRGGTIDPAGPIGAWLGTWLMVTSAPAVIAAAGLCFPRVRDAAAAGLALFDRLWKGDGDQAAESGGAVRQPSRWAWWPPLVTFGFTARALFGFAIWTRESDAPLAALRAGPGALALGVWFAACGSSLLVAATAILPRSVAGGGPARLWRLALAGALFVAAILAKENAVLLVLSLAAMAATVGLPGTPLLPGRRTRVAVAALLLAAAALVAPLFWIGQLQDHWKIGEAADSVVHYVKEMWSPNLSQRNFSMGERLMTEGRVVMRYLGLLLLPLPSHLNVDHHVIPSRSLAAPPATLAAMLALGALLAAALLLRRRRPLLALGVFFFFAHHAMEATIIDAELMFEHRNYTPAIGVALIGAVAGARALRRAPGWCGGALAGAAALALGWVTIDRNATWATAVSLWEDAAAKSPKKARPHGNLAAALGDEGSRLDRRALRSDLTAEEVADLRARAEAVYRRQLEEATLAVRSVEQNEAFLTQYEMTLGNALRRLDRLPEALEVYLRILARLRPAVQLDVESAVALCYAQLGEQTGERRHYEQAVPYYLTAIAVEEQSRALRVTQLRRDDTFADSYHGLAYVFERLGNRDAAEHYYRKALGVLEVHREARFYLGQLLATTPGREEEGFAHLRRFAAEYPQDARAAAIRSKVPPGPQA